jgi:lysine 2,3-aminomutase
VPFVGKRWVHQADSYDTERGMSFWRKNYRTSIEGADSVEEALSRDHVYYDPIYTLPESGQQWWREQGDHEAAHDEALRRAAASRGAAARDAALV